MVRQKQNNSNIQTVQIKREKKSNLQMHLMLETPSLSTKGGVNLLCTMLRKRGVERKIISSKS